MLSERIRPIIFYIIFFPCLLALNLLSDNYDYDFWARLVVGKHFIQTGHLLMHDIFSYTPTHRIIDHEWGSSVVFYLVQHFFSHIGLVLLQTIILFSIFVLIIQIVKLRGVKTTHPYNLLFYIFAAAALMQIYYQPFRCQLFTFLFFTLFLYILELARKGINWPLFSIPIIMLIWCNMHGGCVSGLGLILLYIIGELLSRKPVKKYILALASAFLVLPINPWGIDYVIFLIQANTMHREIILEWMSLFSPEFKYIFIEFKYFISVIFIFEIGYIIKSLMTKSFVLDVTKYLVVIATSTLAILHIKLIPLAVITLSTFLYDDFYSFFNFITRNACNRLANVKDILVYITVIVILLVNVRKESIEPFLDFKKFPIVAIEFMKINEIKGNLLINFELGSYAIYKLYPSNLVFIDGRYEEVYDNSLKQTLDIFTSDLDKSGYLLKTYPTDIILIYKKCKVYPSLLNDRGWIQIFVDDNYALFVKSSNVKKAYKVPPLNIEYYKTHLFDTNVNFERQK